MKTKTAERLDVRSRYFEQGRLSELLIDFVAGSTVAGRDTD
jgi:hypothetical protein